MILSNREIHRALDEHRLVITPQPAPRRPSDEGAPCPFQTSAVDLRLGDEIAWFAESERLPITIDLRSGGFLKLFKAASRSRTLSDGEAFNLELGRLVLAKTLERVELPITPGASSLAARVEGRSSYARCGLLVHFTAPTIHAGFRGTITLEMMNFGPYPISLYKGLPICQLVVEEVLGEPFSNDSQFQGQATAGGHA